MPKKPSKKREQEIIAKYGKIPTKQELFEKIKESQERIIISLVKAWEVVPDNIEDRKQLLEASGKAMNLRDSLYKKLLREEPPSLKKSYNKLSKILEKESSNN